MGMKRVVVHIDRLVLRGVRQEDRHAVAAGLQQELQRVFGDREAVSKLRGMGDVSRLQVNGPNIRDSSEPQRLGQSVAQGIGAEIRK
jgi:hypothetical protein